MKKSWLLLLIPLLLVLWWGLSRGHSIPTAHFAEVRRATVESTVSTNGKAEPAQWAAARAENAGVVTAVEVTRGDLVKQGQVLVTLDTASARSTLAAAQAQEQQAATDLSVLQQGGKQGQRASIEDQIRADQAALEVAQRNYDSLQRLASQNAATRLQLQDAKDALDRARLQLESAQNQQHSLVTPGDRSVAQARLADAKAAVTLAQHQLQLGRIAAPMAGTLYQFDLKVGAYLQAGDLVGLIGDLDQMKVAVYVDEPDLGRVALGMPVKVTWDARPGQIWWGKVTKMPTEIVALGSRTVGEVSTVVDNPSHDLLPGVSTNAVIVSRVVRDAITIPKAALRNLKGSDGVYKLQGDIIRWTPVKAGVSDVNNVQVLSGLSIGDRVLDRAVDPSDAEFKDGMRVKAVTD